MVATHNIKVNGRWYRAGQEIPEEKTSGAVKKAIKEGQAVELKVEEPAVAEQAKEEVAEAPKRTSNRRKTTK